MPAIVKSAHYNKQKYCNASAQQCENSEKHGASFISLQQNNYSQLTEQSMNIGRIA